MKRSAIALVVILALVAYLSTVPVASVAAQDAPSAARVVLPTERTVLPIPEPRHPHSTVLDARNATPPPRFEVRAPAGAPNVLIFLIDDMGSANPVRSADRSGCPPWIDWPAKGCGITISTPRRFALPRGPRCSAAATTT